METALSPIALFVYNRPEHTLKTLEALAENRLAEKSSLYIFSDGEKKSSTTEQINKVKETRKLIANFNWPGKLTIIESETNKGLANSIIEGVTKLINEYGKIIVLEDDLLVSNYFLQYMNNGLTEYQKVNNVYSINGFMFPLKTNEKRTYLLPYTSTWGWATWKEKWTIFNPTINQIDISVLQNNHALKSRFNLFDYSFTDMLNFDNNSWGIKWYYSVFCHNGLNVFPSISMVHNIGNDGTGVNSKAENNISLFKKDNDVDIVLENRLDLLFLDKYYNYFKSNKKNKFTLKTKSLLKKLNLNKKD